MYVLHFMNKIIDHIVTSSLYFAIFIHMCVCVCVIIIIIIIYGLLVFAARELKIYTEGRV